MSKIKTLNVKRCVAVFMAVLMMVLSLSYTNNNNYTDASNNRQQYYVYDAKTGDKIDGYYLDSVPLENNSRTVIGDKDERGIDWSKSGVVKVIDNTGSYSGFVVGDHVIATAAHCVYSNKEKESSKINKVLLFDTNGTVTLEATPVEYHIPSLYINDNRKISEIYDYALISVKEDLSAYACFDLGVPLESFANGNPVVTVTGFPGVIGVFPDWIRVNTDAEHMMYSGNGIVTNIDNKDLLFYEADTMGGNSGGPVYITESLNGKTYYTVVAIHTQGTDCSTVGHSIANHGTCITTNLIHFYKQNEYIFWE